MKGRIRILIRVRVRFRVKLTCVAFVGIELGILSSFSCLIFKIALFVASSSNIVDVASDASASITAFSDASAFG